MKQSKINHPQNQKEIIHASSNSNQMRPNQKKQIESNARQSPTHQYLKQNAKPSLQQNAQRPLGKPEPQQKNADIMNQNLIEKPGFDYHQSQFQNPRYAPISHEYHQMTPHYPPYLNEKTHGQHKYQQLYPDHQDFARQRQQFQGLPEGMSPQFEYMHHQMQQSHGHPLPHSSQLHFREPMSAQMEDRQPHNYGQDPHHGMQRGAQLKNVLQPQKNYDSEYQSDPHALLNLIDHQREVVGGQKQKMEEEYLSFSEASEDYEYYFCRVKKNRNGEINQNNDGVVNAEVVQPSSSQAEKLNLITYGSTNKKKYEAPLNLINESSQENISGELSGRMRDKIDISNNLIKQRKSKKERQLEKSLNKDQLTNSQGESQQMENQTISSIQLNGQKSNSILMISKFDSQNEASILTPYRNGRKSQSPEILRDTTCDQIQVYNIKQMNPENSLKNMEFILTKDSSKNKYENINVQTKQINLDQKVVNAPKALATPKTGTDGKSKKQVQVQKQDSKNSPRRKWEGEQKQSRVSPTTKSKTQRMNKQAQQNNTKHMRKQSKDRVIIHIKEPLKEKEQLDARAQVQQISLKSKNINLMNSQDSTQPATGNESSFKNQVLDSQQRIQAKIDSSSPSGDKEIQLAIVPIKQESKTKGSHKRQKSNPEVKSSSNHNQYLKKLNGLDEYVNKAEVFSNDNPFQLAGDTENVHTPCQTKYTEEFPSALAYPKNNFQTPFGGQTASDISALTHPKMSKLSPRPTKLQTGNNNHAIQLYGEMGKTQMNSNKTSMTSQKNSKTKNAYWSDRKSMRSHTQYTNTTAMVDEMSLPDERSIDFKLNDFGAKNLRQVVREEDNILLNKIKKVNPEQKSLFPSSGVAKNQTQPVKYQPITKAAKTNSRFDKKNNNALVEITPMSQSIVPQKVVDSSKPPIPNKTQRPRIKHTFRGGNTYEHVSLSPTRNQTSLKDNKIQDPKKQNDMKTLHQPQRSVSPNLIQRQEKRKLPQRPLQVQASDVSISGISKEPNSPKKLASKHTSPKKYKEVVRRSNKEQELTDYKLVETLELDHQYSPENFNHGNFNYFNNQFPDERMNFGPHYQEHPHFFGGVHAIPIQEQQNFFYNHNHMNHAHMSHGRSRSSSGQDNFGFHIQSSNQRESESNMLSQANPLAKSIQSNTQGYAHQESENSQVIFEKQRMNKSKDSSLKRKQNNFCHTSNDNITRSNIQNSSQDQSIMNSRNQQSNVRNSAKTNIRNKQGKDGSNSSLSNRIIEQKANTSDIITQNDIQSRQKPLDSKQRSLKNTLNQHFSPQVFDGSSFGGSQIVGSQIFQSGQQSSVKDPSTLGNNQASLPGVTKFPGALGMDNRPYIPKATVILNQDTDYEQLDMIDQRPFSQTVVEVPVVVSQPSRSSLNQSKKSIEKTKSLVDSQNSDQGLRSSRDRLNTGLNSLYTKTESQQSWTTKRSYLRKGEGTGKQLSSKDSRGAAETTNKRSDSQKATNLYFKALKEVGTSSTKQPNRQNSKDSNFSSSGDRRRNQQLIRVPGSGGGKNNDNLYYNTQQPKHTPTNMSYKQKQISSIEKLKKELARSQNRQNPNSIQKSNLNKKQHELLQMGKVIRSSPTRSEQSWGSRGSKGKTLQTMPPKNIIKPLYKY